MANEALQAALTERYDALSTSLRSQFQVEVRRSTERLDEGIAPYSRFVRAERQALDAVRTTLGEMDGRLQTLQARIEGMA